MNFQEFKLAVLHVEDPPPTCDGTSRLWTKPPPRFNAQSTTRPLSTEPPGPRVRALAEPPPPVSSISSTISIHGWNKREEWLKWQEEHCTKLHTFSGYRRLTHIADAATLDTSRIVLGVRPAFGFSVCALSHQKTFCPSIRELRHEDNLRQY